MHIHNALHHFVRVQDGYRKAIGEADPEFTGIERAGETLTPIINLWDRDRPDWAFLRGEFLWAIAPSISATVGEFGQVGVINPTASGVICVVNHIEGRLTAGAVIEVRIGAQVAVDSVATPVPIDTRAGIISTGVGPLISFAHDAAARIGGLVFQRSQASSLVWEGPMPFPIVLSPGFFVAVGSASTNTGVAGTLAGYFRRAFEGELVTV